MLMLYTQKIKINALYCIVDRPNGLKSAVGSSYFVDLGAPAKCQKNNLIGGIEERESTLVGPFPG
jgi:hypothetical protein